MSIHPTAIVDEDAELGPDVEVGPFSIIHAGTRINGRASVGSHCEIGLPTPLAKSDYVTIGEGSQIRSHSVIYQGVDLSGGIQTGHRVTIRENTVAGEDFQLGTLSDIQGDCEIGDFVRTHSNVHIGKHSRIGNFVWIFPYVVLTNDPHPPSEVQSGVVVEDYVAIATMAVVLPGIRLGEGCLIGAGTTVIRDVPPGRIAAGMPSADRGPAASIRMRDGTDQPAYPWRRHFHRGYPAEVVEAWQQEFPDAHA
jgi:acyl-[acyl carrier protein]--UDP-N-acetylglucosamine O-acyltransferase